MKALRKIVIAVLIVPVLLLLVSFLLPSKYRVERSLMVRGTPEAVFTNINTLKHWPEWTAWTTSKYPDMQISFSGPESGVGATYAWDGKSTGHGMLKLLRSEPQKGVGYELQFDHGRYVSQGGIDIEKAGEGLRVLWFNEGNLGWNPVSRYFGLLMDRMIGPDFEEGLRNLQKRAEGK